MFKRITAFIIVFSMIIGNVFCVYADDDVLPDTGDTENVTTIIEENNSSDNITEGDNTGMSEEDPDEDLYNNDDLNDGNDDDCSV